MLLGRSQEVPHGREEETHPMGRFFTVFSSASGICYWQTVQGPALRSSLPVFLFLLLIDFLPIQNKFCQIIFPDTHLDPKSQCLSSLCGWWWRMWQLSSTWLQLTGIWHSWWFKSSKWSWEIFLNTSKITLILYVAFWLFNEVGSPPCTKLAVKLLL